ncbi:hypothetical protein KC19_6G169800 [Ceratodon purpureus]|uniref:Uncharacterized protein n=1 Tax=Ceratodon purpureus TaxID=3225 RepID=A0A8T0HI33_CERPU|nr:hypothetical protein KC19_6G169800 [Ceratodon purpureus]
MWFREKRTFTCLGSRLPVLQMRNLLQLGVNVSGFGCFGSGSGVGMPPTWWCGFLDHDMDHGYPLWSLGPSWRVKANLHNQLICLPTAAQCVDFGDSFGGWNSMILNVEPQLSLTYFKECWEPFWRQ